MQFRLATFLVISALIAIGIAVFSDYIDVDPPPEVVVDVIHAIESLPIETSYTGFLNATGLPDGQMSPPMGGSMVAHYRWTIVNDYEMELYLNHDNSLVEAACIYADSSTPSKPPYFRFTWTWHRLGKRTVWDDLFEIDNKPP